MDTDDFLLDAEFSFFYKKMDNRKIDLAHILFDSISTFVTR